MTLTNEQETYIEAVTRKVTGDETTYLDAKRLVTLMWEAGYAAGYRAALADMKEATDGEQG